MLTKLVYDGWSQEYLFCTFICQFEPGKCPGSYDCCLFDRSKRFAGFCFQILFAEQRKIDQNWLLGGDGEKLPRPDRQGFQPNNATNLWRTMVHQKARGNLNGPSLHFKFFMTKAYAVWRRSQTTFFLLFSALNLNLHIFGLPTQLFLST